MPAIIIRQRRSGDEAEILISGVSQHNENGRWPGGPFEQLKQLATWKVSISNF